MHRTRRIRYQIERALAVLCAVALAITLVVPDWIERLFEISPDGGDSSAEWALSIGLVIATVAFSLLARHDRRALRHSG